VPSILAYSAKSNEPALNHGTQTLQQLPETSGVVPYVVVRANNIPLDALAAITRSDVVEQLAAEVAGLRAALQPLTAEACDQLYQRASNDGEHYRALIDLKRRIFKGAQPQELRAKYGDWLSQLPELQAWQQAAQRLQALETQLTSTFEHAHAHARQQAQQLSAQSSFSQALAFTRGPIAASAQHYRQTRVFADKGALNDEETIYRYLTRAITKVSPFSTFTSVGFAQVQNAAPRNVARGADVDNVYSVDRSTLLKLYERFVLCYKAHWRYRLTANRVDGDDRQFFYLFSNRYDIYPFRTAIAKTSVAASARSLYDALAADWLTWPQICALLPAKVDADAMLEKWLTAGMLLYTPRLDEQAADVVSAFRAVAERVAAGEAAGAGIATEVARTLASVEAACAELPQVAASELPARIAAINDALNGLAELLGFMLIKTSGLVYNDSYLRTLSAVDHGDMARFAAQISEFIDGYLGRNFRDGLRDETLAALRAAVPADQPMPIFAFHDVVQRCLTPAALNSNQPTAAQALLAGLFEDVWQRRHEDEIVLQPKPLAADARRQTFSAFGHVVDGKMVLNNLDSGFLRCFSRFFTFTDDPEILRACRAAYGSTLEQAYDFYDTFGFNTACRPRICSGRVWLDAVEQPSDGDLTLAALDVVWPAAQAYPSLRRRDTGAPVQLRHTSLFITELYPRLIETLMRFAGIEDPCYFAFRFGLFKRIVDADAPGPVYFPRVRYRDIVLSRRQWWFRKAALLQRLPGEEGLTYFRRIDAWRREQGLPQRVFVRRHQLDKVLERDISNQKKPLFLDFSAPIMSRMIGRVFNTPFDYLSAEEMLPDHDHDFVVDGDKRYASEIILEQTRGIMENPVP
jgi:hypothetical protein